MSPSLCPNPHAPNEEGNKTLNELQGITLSIFELCISNLIATVARCPLHDYVRDLLALDKGAHYSSITLECALKVRLHYIHIAENSQSWMSNDYVTVFF